MKNAFSLGSLVAGVAFGHYRLLASADGSRNDLASFKARPLCSEGWS